MFRFAADENFNNDVLRGIKRLYPEFDVVRLQDTEIAGASDPEVLQWTATEDRILLTHDIKTMPPYAYQRIVAGLPLPGVFEIPDEVPTGVVISELMLIIQSSNPDEWRDRVTFIPL